MARFGKTKQTGRKTSANKPRKTKKALPTNPAEDEQSSDSEAEADPVDDPNKILNEEDEAEENDHIIWADDMIKRAVHGMIGENPKMPRIDVLKKFLVWVTDAIAFPSRPNRYKHWGVKIKHAFNSYDDQALTEESVSALLGWRRQKAKSLAAKKLYEPSQAERFRLEDMIELWLHWLSSGKPVRVEAALYSAMTFFTGARAIEIGNLMIEDLRMNPDGSALVMPIRQSKTNVFKDTPERLTLHFMDDCPLDLKALYLRVKGDRKEGRLFQACKNRRTLCYHYGRGAMELRWTRVPTGHSGRTTAITMGIAAGIPQVDLEIMFRWATGSDMYRRYRSIHMEESPLGAPAMVARALVHSLHGGASGTALRVNKAEIRSSEVDGGWYSKTIDAIYKSEVAVHGIQGTKAIKAEVPGWPSTRNSVELGLGEPQRSVEVKIEPEAEKTCPGQLLGAQQPKSRSQLIQDTLDYLRESDV
jgi:hypothetical protein